MSFGHPPLDRTVRVALLFQRRLDADLLAASLTATRAVTIVSSGSNEFHLACAHRQVDVAILDATDRTAWPNAITEKLLSEKVLKAALLLDSGFHVTRATAAMRSDSVGYVSRDCSLQQLVDVIQRLRVGRKVIEAPPHVIDLSTLESTFQSLRRIDNHGILNLSRREIQVMKLVAEGQKAKEIAVTLGISASTAENHLTRLRKKLHAKSAVDLTRIAFQEGIGAGP